MNKYENLCRETATLLCKGEIDIIALKNLNIDKNIQDYQELLYTFLTRNMSHFNEFMFCSIEIWNKFDDEYWINLLKRLSLSSSKFAAAIECYFDFFYKYLQIDLIQEFSRIDDTDKEIKYLILESYYNWPGRLYINIDDYYHQRVFEKYKVSDTNFKTVHIHLVSQGLKVAEPIVSKKEIKPDSFAIVVAKRPKSWEWAKSFESFERDF